MGVEPSNPSEAEAPFPSAQKVAMESAKVEMHLRMSQRKWVLLAMAIKKMCSVTGESVPSFTHTRLSFLHYNVAIIHVLKLTFYQLSSEYKAVKAKQGSHPQHLREEGWGSIKY
jgi:hypothetical protein